MKRFFPLGIFAALEFYVIISLVYSPVPFGGGGAGVGYTPLTTYVSVSTGVALGILVLLSALSDWVPFKVYLLVSGIVGAACIPFAFTQAPGTTARVMFLIYGILLMFLALTVKIPEHHDAADFRSGPKTI